MQNAKSTFLKLIQAEIGLPALFAARALAVVENSGYDGYDHHHAAVQCPLPAISNGWVNACMQVSTH